MLCFLLALSCLSPLAASISSPVISVGEQSGSNVVLNIADALDLVVSQVAPYATVIVRTSVTDDFGRVWLGNATFTADKTGVVRADRFPSEAGTYTGVDGSGLLWSMHCTGDRCDFGGWFNTNLNGTVYTLTAEAGGVTTKQKFTYLRFYDTAAYGPSPVNTSDLPPVVTKTFTVEKDGFAGYMMSRYSDFNGGKIDTSLPALIFLGGSEGCSPFKTLGPAQIASLGFNVLALAYFSPPGCSIAGLPSSLYHIDIEYFGRALKWLQTQTSNPDYIYLVGVSRGTEAALLTAAKYEAIQKVLIISGSGVAFNESWTIGGEPVPSLLYDSVPSHCLDNVTLNKKAYSVYWCLLRNDTAVQEATIPIMKSTASFLFINGDDGPTGDGVWPSALLSSYATQQIPSNKVEHYVYHGAGHSQFPPLVATTMPTTSFGPDNCLKEPGVPFPLCLGGTPSGVHEAGVDAFQRTLNFLVPYGV